MYILKVAYNKHHYGFQTQPHKETVCDKIMDALKECNYLANDKIIFCGGRTDKGVSAIGNFIVVELSQEPILSHIYSKLKNKGIWIFGYKKIDTIPEVKYRHYRYILPIIPHIDEYNIDLMIEASKKLIGEHSFHNLSKKDRTKEKSPIRTIYDIKIEKNLYYITIDVIGKSFLWNMVRKIITALSEVGKENKPVGWIDELLCENHKGGVPPAPAEGLILMEAKTDIEYIYDKYVLNRFRREWMENYKKTTMKLGVCRNMMEFI
ncbi:tRNA pseudouridine(38-40) synthase TruA [Methanothermococcus okinawensis]|uniref:tRNA pseudouridine synthase A n=1 Tax=Methanothermococcus okinawensis (strain DSM 14208 / JCM 11175 / IH1) TaxID=647113 RepID=F8ANA6_METOI|nr:tRNA pseudouridine(38-40) synthase TruA [Methanothermococcus okinawensis]AEH06165.1 tRNA pseudouridine synthase A [Methanothermococcus okinawensis IH1]